MAKNPNNPKKSNVSPKYLVREHLAEVSARFYVWFSVVLLSSVIGYIFNAQLLNWLILPLNQPLFYSSPAGGFEVVLGVALLFGFVISLPILLYEIIKFVEPAMSKPFGRKMWIVLVMSSLLAFVGIIVAYFIILPAALTFLSKFGDGKVEPLISTKDYFDFVARYLLGFAILFQLPIVVHVMAWVIPITPRWLWKQLRQVVVGCFVIAAILTPTPDLVNQVIMAVPLLALYLLTMLSFYIRNKTVR